MLQLASHVANDPMNAVTTEKQILKSIPIFRDAFNCYLYRNPFNISNT